MFELSAGRGPGSKSAHGKPACRAAVFDVAGGGLWAGTLRGARGVV